FRDIPSISYALGRTTQNNACIEGGPMLRILVLTRYDGLGASSRVRFLQFLSQLSVRGMSFTVQPFLDDDYIAALYSGARPKMIKILIAYVKRFQALLCAGTYDLVWLEKEAFPWLPA